MGHRGRRLRAVRQNAGRCGIATRTGHPKGPSTGIGFLRCGVAGRAVDAEAHLFVHHGRLGRLVRTGHLAGDGRLRWIGEAMARLQHDGQIDVVALDARHGTAGDEVVADRAHDADKEAVR